MARWQFYCDKCKRQFTVNAIEGTKVKCFECDSIFDVPVSEGLEPITDFLDDVVDSILDVFNRGRRSPLLRILKDPVEEMHKDTMERIVDAIFGTIKKTFFDIAEKKVDKMLHGGEAIGPAKIVCSCPNCHQKYGTKSKNEGSIGKCRICETKFKIKSG